MTELQIDLKDVARYLGYHQQEIDSETLRTIEDVVSQLRAVAIPRITHQVFSLQGTALRGTTLRLEGENIATLLQSCDRCILLAATLGQGVDTLLRRLQITDLTRGVIADVCASSMIEWFCNQENEMLEAHWTAQNRHLTSRYSPGYGDLPLTTQAPLCALLNTTKTIGLTTTSTHILTPRKSITAIIGISSVPQEKRRDSCAQCPMAEECKFRKGGTTCE